MVKFLCFITIMNKATLATKLLLIMYIFISLKTKPLQQTECIWSDNLLYLPKYYMSFPPFMTSILHPETIKWKIAETKSFKAYIA